MSYFLVKRAGILSTIQDIGRFGYKDIGITQSGAMDELAYNWCNKLLQNPHNTPLLEITYGDFEIESFGNTTFAFCGGEVDIFLNNQKINLWQTYSINRGDILRVKFLKRGVRVYFGVSGGFIDKKVLGSYSVSIKEEIKRALKKEDKLFFKENKTFLKRFLKRELIPKYPNFLELRVVLGYESELFLKKEIESFFNEIYEIKSHSRMGYIFRANEGVFSSKIEIISNPIAFGAIQITKSGEPIVLLKEHQTIGGYPKIGSVIDIDCFRLSQLKEGDRVKFRLIELKEAIAISKKFHSFFV